MGVGDTGLDTDHCQFFDPNFPNVERNVTIVGHRKVVLYGIVADAFDSVAGHGTHVAGTGITMSQNTRAFIRTQTCSFTITIIHMHTLTDTHTYVHTHTHSRAHTHSRTHINTRGGAYGIGDFI